MDSESEGTDYGSDYEYSESDDDDKIFSPSNNVKTQSDHGTPITIKESNADVYSILVHEEVIPVMKSLITEVSELLSVSESVAEVVLRNFKWNKEIIFDQYCSAEDEFWLKAGVHRGNNAQAALPSKKKRKETFSCGICRDDEALCSESIGLDCNHLFCKDCYEGYLANGVADGPTCVMLTCPEHLCNTAVSSHLVHTLCPSDIYSNYMMYLTRNFIETSTTMRWCPSPGCNKVASVAEHADVDITITCNGCDSEFCFRCGSASHAPLSCELLGRWNLKCADESENYLWIVNNTKKCPKCKQRIEKNGGCMHMTCKSCRHGFCWHCLETWKAEGHTWNHANCAVHIPKDTPKSESDNVAELERYIKYFSRYDEHGKSINFAHKQREAATERMHAMLKDEAQKCSTLIDVEYLIQAVNQVIIGRRELKYSYAFAFFLLDGTREKDLFENSLEMLERHIESLSQLTEGKEDDTTNDEPNEGIAESSVMPERVNESGDLSQNSYRNRCINLTSAIKKSLSSLLETSELNFQFATNTAPSNYKL